MQSKPSMKIEMYALPYHLLMLATVLGLFTLCVAHSDIDTDNQNVTLDERMVGQAQILGDQALANYWHNLELSDQQWTNSADATFYRLFTLEGMVGLAALIARQIKPDDSGQETALEENQPANDGTSSPRDTAA